MKYLIFGVIGIVFLASCATDDTTYEVGSDFIENNIQVRVIDTFSIKAGTFKLDSLITSGTNRILVGNVVDEKLGSISAKSYLQLITSSFSISTDAVYDSIGMVLNYDNYYYGDTTKVQTYTLHRIKETVAPADDATSFYNTSSLAFDPAILGQLSFTPRPNKSTDSLFVKMDDVLGEDIFNKIVDNDINNTDDFLQYFKGLVIAPDTSVNSHVLGFNVQTTASTVGNSSMRLYYSIKDDDSEDNDYYIDFVISSATQQFNEIKTNLSNTIVGEFEDGEEIKLSTSTDNLLFAQGGSGITARIEMPSIKRLAELYENASTLSAELTFNPLKRTYNDDNPLPESLLVYVVDHKNRIIQQLTDIDGNTASAILVEDTYEFNEDTHYRVNLSGFVEQILNSETDLNYALMIQYPNYSKEVNNLVIENNASTNKEIKLSVKYLNY
ncbi:DUF4270 family protein [Polaribacter sp. Q13]|uniref:DUF4270 family protein n=1 Tax=Polaribacter sp. Q13 TaxID=2806551 RepID=UPI00193C82FE|nr:DUF4270 family protein [Polaribacter sp. Q13]QVY67090.1 DUF4270 family protein [Polaribacter sp. Q13]